MVVHCPACGKEYYDDTLESDDIAVAEIAFCDECSKAIFDIEDE